MHLQLLYWHIVIHLSVFPNFVVLALLIISFDNGINEALQACVPHLFQHSPATTNVSFQLVQGEITISIFRRKATSKDYFDELRIRKKWFSPFNM